MQEQNGLNPEQQELESALRSLSPRQAKLNPITAAFEAGRMSRQRQARLLSAVTLMMVFITSASLIWMQHPSSSSLKEKIAASPVSESQEISLSSSSGPTLLTLERKIQSQGTDGLPPTSIPAAASFNANNPL